MTYKTCISILFIAITLIGCGYKNVVTKEKIEFGKSMRCSFELAEISVNTLNAKHGFPITYSKKEIAVCVFSFMGFDNFDLIRKDYQNIDEYWTLQEERDSLNNYYYSHKSKNHIYFQKEQPFISWIKYPFNEHQLIKKSPIKLEEGKWYKLSHVNRKDIDDINYEIIIYVGKQNKLSVFHFFDGKCIRKFGYKPYAGQ